MADFGQPWNGGVPVAAMRASHADRERAVDVLKAAYSEGRLTQPEYEQRIELAYQASTYGELGSLVADLPSGPVPAPAFLPPTQPTVPQIFLPAPPAPVPPMNGLAAASLICGFAGLIFAVPAVPAIVLGYKARSEVRAGNGSGDRAAAAGLALGWLVVSLWGLVLVIAGIA